MRFIIFVLGTLIWNIKIAQLQWASLNGDTANKSDSVKQNMESDIPEIEEYVMKTHIANRFAETTVSSTVRNKGSASGTTSFSVVFPSKAFISGFYIEIDGIKYNASVEEKYNAQKQYGKDVKLPGQTVSTKNTNIFMRNFIIAPKSQMKFHLSYEELLQRDRGQYELITNIQPGQLVKMIKIEVEIKETRPLLYVRTPLLRSSNTMANESAQLDSKAQINISNTSALVKFHMDTNRQLKLACAGLANKEYHGIAGQFVVQYDIERDPQGGETLFQDDFFVHFFAPQTIEPIRKHIVFLLDTSASMTGKKITQMQGAMINIFSQLHSEDLFNIVQYDDSVYVWNLDLNRIDVLPFFPNYTHLASELEVVYVPEDFEVTKDNIESAKKIVKKMVADGGTNTVGGLEVSLYLVKRTKETRKAQYQHIIIFMTDGFPSTGIEDTSEIHSLITGINEYNAAIYSVCIGDDADWNFMQKLSLATNAEAIRIYVEDDISMQLSNFFKTINTPVLTDIVFHTLPSTSHVSQNWLPVFLNGSEIIIAGKGVSGDTIRPIKTSAKGRQGSYDFDGKIGIPLTRLERIWAHLTLGHVLNNSITNELETGIAESQKTALDLSLKYSLVTNMTSLVFLGKDGIPTAITVEDPLYEVLSEPLNKLPICTNITEETVIKEVPTTNFIPNTSESITTAKPFTITLKTTYIKPPTTTKATTSMRPHNATIGTSSTIALLKPPTTTTVRPYSTATSLKPSTTTLRPVTKFVKMPTTAKKTTITETINITTVTPILKLSPTTNPSIKINTLTSKPTDARLVAIPAVIFKPEILTDPIIEKVVVKSCQNIRFGCCQDGVTAATGIKFGGCQPLSKSDSCYQPISIGKCNNAVRRWFYNRRENRCKVFTFSGCSGNSNNFLTLEDCTKLCVTK